MSRTTQVSCVANGPENGGARALVSRLETHWCARKRAHVRPDRSARALENGRSCGRKCVRPDTWVVLSWVVRCPGHTLGAPNLPTSCMPYLAFGLCSSPDPFLWGCRMVDMEAKESLLFGSLNGPSGFEKYWLHASRTVPCSSVAGPRAVRVRAPQALLPPVTAPLWSDCRRCCS